MQEKTTTLTPSIEGDGKEIRRAMIVQKTIGMVLEKQNYGCGLWYSKFMRLSLMEELPVPQGERQHQSDEVGMPSKEECRNEGSFSDRL